MFARIAGAFLNPHSGQSILMSLLDTNKRVDLNTYKEYDQTCNVKQFRSALPVEDHQFLWLLFQAIQQ